MEFDFEDDFRGSAARATASAANPTPAAAFEGQFPAAAWPPPLPGRQSAPLAAGLGGRSACETSSPAAAPPPPLWQERGSSDRQQQQQQQQSMPALPPAPNEDAFVKNDAQLRRLEYERLEAWLAAGGASKDYLPWFRELLMDADVEAFSAACSAIVAHYRREAGEVHHDGGVPAAAPGSWLPVLAERVASAGQLTIFDAGPAGRAVCDSAAELVQASAACCGPQAVWSQLGEMLAGEEAGGSTASSSAAMTLLAICAQRKVVSEDSARRLLLGLRQWPTLLGSSRGRAAWEALAAAMPTLYHEFAHHLAAPSSSSAADVRMGATMVEPPQGTPQKGTCATWGSPIASSPDTADRSRRHAKRGRSSEDPLRVLGENDGKTWQERVKCLKNLGSPAAHGAQGPMLWPQLVMQAEDDHPAVAAEALCVIARLAGRLGDPGDHLAVRLAAAVRARFRDGRSRGIEAAAACVKALASEGGLAMGPLVSFLAQALGCSRERARAAVVLGSNSEASYVLESCHTPARGDPPLSVDLLIHAAAAGRRGTRRGASVIDSLSPAKSEMSFISPGEKHTPSAILPVPDFSPADRDEKFAWTFSSRKPGRTPTSATPSRYATLTASPARLRNEAKRPVSPVAPLVMDVHTPRSRMRTSSADYADFPSSINGSPALPPSERQEQSVARTPPRRSSKQWLESSSTPALRGATTALTQRLDDDAALTVKPMQQRQQRRSSSMGGSSASMAGPQLEAVSRLLSPSTVLKSGGAISSLGRSTAEVPTTASRSLAVEQAAELTTTSACEVAAVVDLGLQALLAPSGGDSEVWYEAVRIMVRWDGAVSCEEGDAADAAAGVVATLLEAAPKLSAEGHHHLWNALGDLKDAPWLTDAALLELTVVHCLRFLEPAVVAAFLAAQVADGRLCTSQCLDFCLKQMLAPGGGHLRFARLLHMLAGALSRASGSLWTDFELPSLGPVLEVFAQRRLPVASIPHIGAALEVLLQHMSPTSISERSWTQLRQLLQYSQRGDRATSAAPQVPAASSMTPSAEAEEVSPTQSPLAPVASTPVVTLTPPAAPATPAPTGHGMADTASPDGELKALCRRLHGLTIDLAKGEGEDLPLVLKGLTEELTRPQHMPPLQAFMRRLLTRQRLRHAMKENLPPTPGGKPYPPSPAKDGDFIEDDYASVRQLAEDERLVGAFPLSLLAHLKRLLTAPAAVGTHRAAAECVGATATACGPLLLKVLLQMFAGCLLRVAASRGPAQLPARAALRQFVVLSECAASSSRSPELLLHGSGGEGADAAAPAAARWLRQVWRAVASAARRTGGQQGGPGSSNNDPGLMTEALRWLADDALVLPGALAGLGEVREMISAGALGLQDRSPAVRLAAARAVRRIAQARGDFLFREDVRNHPSLSNSAKSLVLASVEPGGGSSLATPSNDMPSRRSPQLASSGSASQLAPSGYPPLCPGSATRSSSSSKRRLLFSPVTEVASPVHPEQSRQKAPLERSRSAGAVVSSESRSAGGPRSMTMQAAAAAAADGTGAAAANASSLAAWPAATTRAMTPDSLQAARRRVAEARAAEAQARGRGLHGSAGGNTLASLQGSLEASYRPPLSGSRAVSPEPSGMMPLSPTLSAASPLHQSFAVAAAELEADMTAWIADIDACRGSVATLRGSSSLTESALQERASDVTSRLEAFLLRQSGQHLTGSVEVAPVAVATLALCERLVAQAVDFEAVDVGSKTASEGSLAAAVMIATALRSAFAPVASQAFKRFCAASAAPALRSALRALSQLQQLSRSEALAVKQGAARALLVFPPLLAAMMDTLEASTQLVAWVRVASEFLADGPPRAAAADGKVLGEDSASSRRWALKFCSRCMERCGPLLPADGPDFPAWEVLSEVSRVSALLQQCGAEASPAAAAWLEDCAEWYRALEAVAEITSSRYPAQAREFLLLASCTGSPLPPALVERIQRVSATSTA
eukprot:TRINITY_DN58851_c0_g1_i1.p1 TRINITY_DN58851_c0_g1~~TRINITY_DN58851_c0_g1_i1.p1  ORF type:complete len:1960 (-),score=488.46 TRINITY_DN58851_c0_g1_i1:273-6152(-)